MEYFHYSEELLFPHPVLTTDPGNTLCLGSDFTPAAPHNTKQDTHLLATALEKMSGRLNCWLNLLYFNSVFHTCLIVCRFVYLCFCI